MSEKEQLRYKMIAYGYTSGDKCLSLDDNLRKIYSLIASNVGNLQEGRAFADEKMIDEITLDFYKKHFKTHDVLYLPMQRCVEIAKRIMSSEGMITSSQLVEFKQALLESSKLISPFDLPVVYGPGHSMIGDIKKSLVLVPDEEFLRDYPIMFDSIFLGSDMTKVSAATKIHEIGHSQLESVKSSQRNYLNSEIITIFLEKIAINEIRAKLLRYSELKRFEFMKDHMCYLDSRLNIPYTERLKASLYIQSTLQAEKLYDIYCNSNIEVKKNILESIQKIFDGLMTVEDLLSLYNITYENSKDLELIKRHL